MIPMIRRFGFTILIGFALVCVSQAQDATDFFAAGAHAVMLGSSPVYLPDIASELR